MIRIVTAWFLFSVVGAWTQIPSGEAILQKIDKNMVSGNRISTSKMVIHGRRESRTIEAKSWIQGIDKAFTEYLAPAREKGSKMLKLGDQLWIYSPTTDRIIQISGHLLRQSVMGSDLSYEDLMEDPKLVTHYQAEVESTEVVDGRACWVLILTAEKQDIAYYARRLWVDQERDIPLQEELYAKGGRLLKKINLKDVKKIADRWYPMHIYFKDMLKTGQGTEFIVESIEFDQTLPEYIFSKAALKK